MLSAEAEQGWPSRPAGPSSGGLPGESAAAPAAPDAPATRPGGADGGGYAWLARLTTGATLADLPWHDCRVRASEPGARVAERFDARPDLPGVIVVADGGAAGDGPAGGEPRGVISRPAFFRRLSQRFSRELFLRRPIELMFGAPADGRDRPAAAPPRLPWGCPVGEAARRLLDRPADDVYEPVLVEAADGEVRLLDAHVVLLAQARVLELTQVAMVQNEKLASLGQLAAGLAHEVNNPLSFATNNLAVLRRDAAGLRRVLGTYRAADAFLAQARPDLAAAVREAADAIDLEYTADNLDDLIDRSLEGLRRIRQIVNDLRDFARLDESDLHEVDLNDGIRSTARVLGRRAAERGVTIRLEPGELPPVACYPARVNQVVMNLMTNAIDACAPGGTVVVRSRPDPSAGPGGGVAVEVEDDGAGIDPAVLPRIFDPFFTTRPPGRGTGLGLSISYGIVREHRGRIDVASRPGRGSTFRVLLPASRPGR